MKWFTNLKISVKLMISYIILCVLMFLVGLMGISGLNMMNDNANSMYYDAMTGLSNINESRANIEGIQVYVQRLVMPEYKDQIPAIEAEMAKRTAANNIALQAYENSMTNPEDRVMYQKLKELLSIYRDKRVKTVEYVKNGDYAAAREMYYTELSAATLATVEHINKMSAWNNEVGKSYMLEAEEKYNSSSLLMMITIGAGIVFAIILGFFITSVIAKPLRGLINIFQGIADGDLSHTQIDSGRKDEIGQLEKSVEFMVNNLRDVIQNVQDSADNVAASSEELTASADQSAQAANSVATSIMSVSQVAERQLIIVDGAVRAAQNISEESSQIANNTNAVAATSDKAAQAAARGDTAVETAVNQMSFIQKTIEDLSQEILGLGTRSREIGQIVETISGIASQTNLLALNAAIEAARAGEQGRGFAVVAEEVRKLAEQSQEAAKQISSLIGGIQNDTSNAVQAMEAGTREVKTGSELVDNAGIAFKEITGLIEQTSSQVREISKSIQEMAKNSQELVIGSQEVNKLSQNTSSQTQTVSAATEEQLATMQEIASSSQALAKRAEDLQAIVQKFIL